MKRMTANDNDECYDNIVTPKCAYVIFHFLQDNGITSEPWQDRFVAELKTALSRLPEAYPT